MLKYISFIILLVGFLYLSFYEDTKSLEYHCRKFIQVSKNKDAIDAYILYRARVSIIGRSIQDVNFNIDIVKEQLKYTPQLKEKHYSYAESFLRRSIEKLKEQEEKFELSEAEIISYISQETDYKLPKNYDINHNSDRLLLDKLRKKINEFEHFTMSLIKN
jgi:hypothetical protein